MSLSWRQGSAKFASVSERVPVRVLAGVPFLVTDCPRCRVRRRRRHQTSMRYALRVSPYVVLACAAWQRNRDLTSPLDPLHSPSAFSSERATLRASLPAN